MPRWAHIHEKRFTQTTLLAAIPEAIKASQTLTYGNRVFRCTNSTQ